MNTTSTEQAPRTPDHSEALEVMIHGRRIPNAPRTGAAEAERHWRSLGAAMYRMLGSPQLEGVSRDTVERVLKGEVLVDEAFVSKMFTALYRTIGDVVNTASALDPTRAIEPPNNPSAWRTATLLLRDMAAHPQQPRPLTEMMHQRFYESLREREPMFRSMAVQAAVAPKTVSTRARRTPPVGPPPTPEGAGTAAAFMARVRELRSWSGFSLRGLEEEAKQRGIILPRSSLSDALNRDVLLPADMLNALTLCCGLGPDAQVQWANAYRQLGYRSAHVQPAPDAAEGDAAAAPAKRKKLLKRQRSRVAGAPRS